MMPAPPAPARFQTAPPGFPASPVLAQQAAVIPQAGMPQAGIPQAGMPQPGMPQPAMPQAAMPHAGMPQTNMPQARPPQAGMPQGGMPQSTLLPATARGGEPRPKVRLQAPDEKPASMQAAAARLSLPPPEALGISTAAAAPVAAAAITPAVAAPVEGPPIDWNATKHRL